MKSMAVSRNKKMKETIGRNFEREPTPHETEAAVRNVARGSGDVAETEVFEELRKKAAEMGESFRSELSREDLEIIRQQEQLGRTYAYKLRRDGTDTVPRDLSSLEGNMSHVDCEDGVLVFWESFKPGKEAHREATKSVDVRERRGTGMSDEVLTREWKEKGYRLVGQVDSVPDSVRRDTAKKVIDQGEYYLVFQWDEALYKEYNE
jgi:hypothetical protein